MSRSFDRLPPKIHTYTGKMVDVTNLRVRDIDIEDIAHALSNQCRFSGHTKRFYSVAQHCVLVSEIITELRGLLHDGAEAYLQDMARPLKVHPRLGQAYRGLEHRIQRVVEEAFSFEGSWDPDIVEADNIVLVTEARDLMHGTKDWTAYKDVTPLEKEIKAWSPTRAKRAFLSRYQDLAS